MNSIFNLSGKTALITGASSGLGENFSKCLVRSGARVILAARRLDKLKNLAKELKNAIPIQMDVADQQSVENAFNSIEKSNERIDICINNAGITKLTPLFAKDDQNDFEKILQTNITGVWYVTKHVAQHMKYHKIHGAIINIGSVNGDSIPAYKGSAYSISKAAVIHLTKSLVSELSSYNIRINCISPGWFKTPMNDPNIEKIIPLIPCGKIAAPKDMDGLILYLSSNKASSYVTGSCFTIDGGISVNKINPF